VSTIHRVISEFIEQFTYLGVFLVLLASGMGAPVPEEIPIAAGGALAQQGVIRWWMALPVCLAGVLAGDVILYWSGHHWGERILQWHVVRLVLSREREEALKRRYRRHGVKILFLARHVLGLRAAAFLTAGIAHVPFWRFLLVDAMAAVVSVSMAFGLGYIFTDQLTGALADVHRIERWMGTLALLAALAWFGIAVWRKNRTQ
jgi:membrane protein DedA with SNARE-associated domain